mgnify:FL=1
MTVSIYNVLGLGCAAAGLAALIHALVPRAWTKRRPFGCALCLAAWSSLLLVGIAEWGSGWDRALHLVIEWLSVTGLGAFLASQIITPPLELP